MESRTPENKTSKASAPAAPASASREVLRPGDRSGERRKQRHRKRKYESRFRDGHRKIGQTEMETMLVEELGLPATTAKKVMRAIRENMARALLEGHEVGITGVGTIRPVIRIQGHLETPGLYIEPWPGIVQELNPPEVKKEIRSDQERTLKITVSRMLLKRMREED